MSDAHASFSAYCSFVVCLPHHSTENFTCKITNHTSFVETKTFSAFRFLCPKRLVIPFFLKLVLWFLQLYLVLSLHLASLRAPLPTRPPLMEAGLMLSCGPRLPCPQPHQLHVGHCENFKFSFSLKFCTETATYLLDLPSQMYCLHLNLTLSKKTLPFSSKEICSSPGILSCLCHLPRF